MKTLRMLWLTTGLVASLGTAGCWDDDDEVAAAPAPVAPAPTPPPAPAPPPPAAATAVPDSAGLSVTAFLDFLLTLSNSETSEPLTIGSAFAVPADETSEPRTLAPQ